MSDIDFQNGLVVGMALGGKNNLNSSFELSTGTSFSSDLLLSSLRFQDIGGIPTSYTNSTAKLSYAGVVSSINALASANPTKVSVDNIGLSFNGNIQYAIRVNDDLEKPIVGFSMSIHGNEDFAQKGMIDLITYLLASTNPLHIKVMETVSIYVVVTANPDGMILAQRNNGNNVNLNRNYPYYWSATLDADKGASPLSEPENINITTWLNSSRLGRIQSWLDIHGWDSSTTYGFLHEQMYHSIKSRRIQRLHFHYIQSLLGKRSYSGLTIVNSTPTLTEYISARKPYIYTWVKNKSRKDVYCGIYEYPTSENVGVVNTATTDIIFGSILATYDYVKSDVKGALVVTKQLTLINKNSNLDNWDSVELRPDWFTLTGLSATQVRDGLSGKKYVETHRAEFVQWLYEVSSGGYCVTSTDFFIAGGTDGVSLSSVRGENMVTGVEVACLALPKYIAQGAMATDNRYLYFSCGYSGGYLKSIYRFDTWNKGLGWSLWKTLAVARQRHSMAYWNGKLVITGGRDSAAYRNDILLVDVATGVETTLGTFATARGYHSSCVYGNYLFIIGGFYGATVSGNLIKIDLTTGTTITAYALPQPIQKASVAVNGTDAFICLGNNGTSDLSTVYKFNMSTGVFTDIVYDLDSDTDEDGNILYITAPSYIGSQAYYNTANDRVIIAGGQSGTTYSQKVYELDIADNLMSLRQTFENEYGYIRASSKFECSVGESYSLNVSIRNGSPITDTKNPYIRLLILTNPLDNIQRKIRSQYIIPPADDFATFSLGFDIEEGETEFRAYVRHYGKNTDIQFSDFQILNSNTNGLIIPMVGSKSSAIDINLNNEDSVNIAFEPLFGSQLNIKQDIFELFTESGSSHDNIKLKYISVPTLDKTQSTGKFVLEFTKVSTSVVTIADLLTSVGINHGKNFSSNREDAVHFRMYPSGADVVAEIWVNNRMGSYTIAAANINYLSVSSVGSGIIFHNIQP